MFMQTQHHMSRADVLANPWVRVGCAPELPTDSKMHAVGSLETQWLKGSLGVPEAAWVGLA